MWIKKIANYLCSWITDVIAFINSTRHKANKRDSADFAKVPKNKSAEPNVQKISIISFENRSDRFGHRKNSWMRNFGV